MGLDVFCSRSVLLACGADGYSGGRISVRTFIIFHDCTHESFFKSRRSNFFLGFITGVLTFTPYHHWRWEHSVHHSSAGDLDRRGMGDVWTLTVQEYLEASPWKRFAYRLARNPFVLFVLAPMVLFIVLNRMPARDAKSPSAAGLMPQTSPSPLWPSHLPRSSASKPTSSFNCRSCSWPVRSSVAFLRAASI